MEDLMIKKKLAIIGTGNISKFHCNAFKEAGFDLRSDGLALGN